MTTEDVADVFPHFDTPETGAFSPVIELDSAILGRKHLLRVYLPPGYDENTLRRYPVLYMQDGKNLFFPEDAFLGREWGVGEAVQLLDTMNAVDRVVIVGVHSGDRMGEYTKPGYEAYARSVVEEIKPEVDRRIRVLTSPSETGVIGSSLGGVVSFFMAWEYPQVFGYAACMSSTFPAQRTTCIDRVLAEPKHTSRFYLDSGWPGRQLRGHAGDGDGARPAGLPRARGLPARRLPAGGARRAGLGTAACTCRCSWDSAPSPPPSAGGPPPDERFLLAATAAAAAVAAAPVYAQDLTPRAYVITPLRSNAINLSYIFNDGELLFEGTVPITDATGRLNVPAISLYRSLNVSAAPPTSRPRCPYAVGNFKGTAFGAETSVYRSGLLDSVFRVSVNLGRPRDGASEMRQRRWQQKQLLGASLKIVAPTGQYDPTKLINLGANRWALKPELGYSGRWGHWVVDAYAAVWFFTRNPEFFSRNQYVPGTQDQTQDPIGAFETHLSYDFRPRLWVSLDGNFWYGGRTSLDGVENPATLQKSSRIGVTSSFPVTGHQSIKVGVRRRGVRPLRRRLQDRVRRVAVLLAQPAEVSRA